MASPQRSVWWPKTDGHSLTGQVGFCPRRHSSHLVLVFAFMKTVPIFHCPIIEDFLPRHLWLSRFSLQGCGLRVPGGARPFPWTLRVVMQGCHRNPWAVRSSLEWLNYLNPFHGVHGWSVTHPGSGCTWTPSCFLISGHGTFTS